ncbi:alpha/beta fold hydrolase [Cognatilysobacter tabacisoli]|uniref:alpha/beta fold hydrolase n=1 Tax=Cognatilysobacter tabacisoli TaxID=2315424 RepID=UPI000E6AFCBF|nr:alpha/beta fold hydrolase [Lysobacter tabacisoli]
MPPTRTASLSLLLGIALAPLPTLAQQPPASAPPSSLKVPCSTLQLQALGDDAVCGRLLVRESRAPGNTVSLSLPYVVLPATGTKRLDDPVLYLHGGPGLATLENAPRYAQSTSIKALREHRDYVMFDQRGTGLSTPAVCPDFTAELARIEREAPRSSVGTQRKVAAAEACRAELQGQGRDPAAYTSSAIADDVEALRRALGYRQWTVLATSYGSFPAFELARRHPASVRSIVLNSPFPPNSPNRAEQLSTTLEGLAALQRRCNDDAACAAAHPDLRKDAAAVIARVNAAPLKTKDGQIDGYTFTGTVWNLLVRGKTAPLLPEYLKRAAAGDEALVRKVGEPFAGAQSFGTLSFAQQWLVSCHDIYPRPSAAAVRKALADNPDFAPDMDPAETDTVCAALQPTFAPAAFYENANLAVPTLVYAGEYDPATPTSDADATMRLLSKGMLVRVAGASHAPMGTDDCTLGIARRFLADPAGAPDLACLAERPKPAFPGPAALDEFLGSL